MTKQRDSFIFYRSFFEAIKDLPEKDQLHVFKAISEYSLNFKEITLKGLPNTIFKLIKPQLEANNKKFTNGVKGGEHGSKGGRPKTPEKPQGKPLKNPRETPNVNDNVNDNANGIPLFEDFKIYALSKKPTLCHEALKMKYDSWVVNGWKDGNNKKIDRWKSKILSTIPYLKEAKHSQTLFSEPEINDKYLKESCERFNITISDIESLDPDKKKKVLETAKKIQESDRF